MNILRKIKQEVNKYELLLFTNPENAKKYCNQYYNAIELLKECCDVYIQTKSNEFQKWAIAFMDNYFLNDSNILLKFKRKIFEFIIYYKLDKLSIELEEVGIALEKIKTFQIRFEQFKVFFHNDS